MSINEQSISAEKRHYYSSSQGPFHNANNILMFFGGGERGDIVETIMRSLRVGDSLITVSGERGSGKTMLSLVLADRLKHRHNIIRYDLPQVSASLMLRHLLIEICPQHADLITADTAEVGAPNELINRGLAYLGTAIQGKSPGDKPYLFVVDSSADLDKDTIQLLHDVHNLHRGDGPGMQTVLFRRIDSTETNKQAANGDVRLAGYGDATLPENHYRLRRLTLNEISEYLHHHMMLFDFNQRDVFTRDMAYFIADRSHGVFRNINTLARNAFMLASLEDAETVSMSHLLAAGLPAPEPKIQGHGFLWRHRSAVVGTLGLGVLLALAAAIFVGQ